MVRIVNTVGEGQQNLHPMTSWKLLKNRQYTPQYTLTACTNDL